MAVVHPSRMALVPQDDRDFHRRSTPSSRGRSEERGWEHGRRYGRDEDYDKHRDRYRSHRDSEDKRRYRTRSRSNSRNRIRNSRSRDLRGSPEYNDRPDMYRRDDSYYGRGLPQADYLESRRLQRENVVVNVWPPSPPAPTRALHDSDSSEDERRRKRKDKKRRSNKDHDREKDRKRRHRQHRDNSNDTESENEEERRNKRHRNKRSRTKEPATDSEEESRRKRHRSTTPLSKSRNLPSPSRRMGEDDSAADRLRDLSVSGMKPLSFSILDDDYESAASFDDDDDDDDDEVGPQPLYKPSTTSSNKRNDERAYGGALLRGEGSAMAAFLKEGGTEARIPRRGEIGLTSDQIAQFESVGYVMSGSRHRRMNAVRLRKENQVISAEEKRGILKLQKEERERREAILREEFTELVQDKLKVDSSGKIQPE